MRKIVVKKSEKIKEILLEIHLDVDSELLTSALKEVLYKCVETPHKASEYLLANREGAFNKASFFEWSTPRTLVIYKWKAPSEPYTIEIAEVEATEVEANA